MFEQVEEAALSNGALLPDFSEDLDPDEMLSDEDAPDLQDEIAKTLTSLRVRKSLIFRDYEANETVQKLHSRRLQFV